MEPGAGVKCGSCGTANDTDATYCRSCGAKLAAQPSASAQLGPACPSCGRVLPSQYAATCPYCGTFLSAYAAPPAAGAAPPPRPPSYPPPAYQQPYGPPQASMQWSPRDLAALSKMRVFAIVGIIGLILSFSFTFVLSSFNYLSVLIPSSSTVSGVQLAAAALVGILVLLIVGVVLEIMSIIYARGAFRELAEVDRNFHTPLSLTFALYVGFVMIVTGVVVVLSFAFALQSQPPAQPASSASLALLIVGSLVIIVAAILVLIGEIGLLLGIWRFGSRYSESVFKAAAILYIIPFAAVIAPILVLIGTGSAERKLRGLVPPGRQQ